MPAQTLPREMALPLGPPSSPVFDTVWLPVEPADAATPASPARALPAAPLKDRNLNSIPSEAARAQDAGQHKKSVRVVNHRAPAKRAPARSPRSPGAVSSVSRCDGAREGAGADGQAGRAHFCLFSDPVLVSFCELGTGGKINFQGVVISGPHAKRLDLVWIRDGRCSALPLSWLTA